MSNTNEVSMENSIMAKVTSGEIRMKPRWFFIAGSIASFIGLVGLILGSVFLINFTLFLLLKRGPGTGRIFLLLESFPIWIPILAVILVFLGTSLLKRYEFSYKRNIFMIVLTFVAAIVLSAIIIYSLGLDDVWFKRGPLRKLYSDDYPSSLGKYHFRTDR